MVERENGEIVVRVPVRFYRRNGRQMVLSEASAQSPTGPGPTERWSKTWQRHIGGRNNSSLASIHRSTNWESASASTYVSRILQLNSLAPFVVERILKGNEPSGLSMESLRQSIPEIWSRQAWA